MKKLMLLAGLCCLQPTLYAASLDGAVKEMAPVRASDRAFAHFKANYKEAQQVNWYTPDGGNMYCSFHQGDTVNRVFYDKHGYWRYTVLSYPGYDLPEKVKEQVMDNFKCYQITSVNEVRAENIDPVYVVNIENNDHIKVISIFGDEIELKQDLEKL
jgi:hypothetical protein